MRFLKHDDPEATKYLKSIPRYVNKLASDEIPFFIIVDDACVRALVTIHTEPYYFYASAGSNLGRVIMLNSDPMYLDAVFESVGRLVQSEGLAYLVYTNSLIPEELQRMLEKHEFGLIDHAHSMYVELNRIPDAPQGLVFKPMDITQRDHIQQLQTEFFKDTGDLTNPIIQQNLLTLSDEDLDSLFNEDTTFLVMENDETVGIVVISVEQGLLMSIAVSPKHRRKNIARKMLAFALIRLKELGWGKVYLRVHVDNIPAIKLYKSFGFIVESETISYVYYPTCQLLDL